MKYSKGVGALWEAGMMNPMQSLIAFDEQLSYLLQDLVGTLPMVWKSLAIYGVYTIPFFLVWYWFFRDRLVALRAAFAGLLAWFGFNNIISHVVGRERPPQIPSLNFPAHEFLFDRPGPSFPSDHAAFLTAVTLSFFLAGERPTLPYLVSVTVLTVIARIVTAQHWVGDILVGIVVGSLASWIVWRFRAQIDAMCRPMIALLAKVGL